MDKLNRNGLPLAEREALRKRKFEAVPDLAEFLGHIWGRFGYRSKQSVVYSKIIDDVQSSVIDMRVVMARISSLFATEPEFMQEFNKYFCLDGSVDVKNASFRYPSTKTAPVRPVGSEPPRKRQTIVHSYHGIETVLKRHLKKWEEDYSSGVKMWLPRLRKSLKGSQTAMESSSVVGEQRRTSHNRRSKWVHEKSPFEGISSSTDFSNSKGIQKIAIASISHERNRRATNTVTKASVTKFKDGAVSVPPHTFHIQVQSNILGENNKRLNYNPTEIECENPDWSPDAYEEELKELYTHSVPWDRALSLEHAEMGKHLRPTIVVALEELGCSVSDVLRYIIDPDPPSSRKSKVREDLGLQANWERWATVLSALPESTDQAQALAANICEAFEALNKFSIWYTVKDECVPLLKNSQSSPSQTQEYNSLMCRICFTHMCTAHGEFEEDHETAVKKSGQVPHDPGTINYKLGVTTHGRPKAASHQQQQPPRPTTPAGSHDPPPTTSPPRALAVPARLRSHQYWMRTLEIYQRIRNQHKLVNSNRGQFYPCSHEGSCDAARCSCFVAGINCEKTCGCAGAAAAAAAGEEPCPRRFGGCSCARHGVVCWQSRKCACWQMERECDPDLCGKCGAAEALDPRRRAGVAVATNGGGSGGNGRGKARARRGARLCGNVEIQRGVPKRMLVGQSQVAGFGLFTGQRVRKGEFLGEYKGEVLSEPEADRRQILHQHLREYLFVVNRDQQIDSTYAGNKIRFINNSCKPANINCNPVPLLCNGVIRMGLFASRDIEPGVELFFNYGYTEHQVAKFKEVVQARSIASKTAKPVVVGGGQQQQEQQQQQQQQQPKKQQEQQAKAGKKRGRPAGIRQSMFATPAKAVQSSLERRVPRRVVDDSEEEEEGDNEEEGEYDEDSDSSSEGGDLPAAKRIKIDDEDAEDEDDAEEDDDDDDEEEDEDGSEELDSDRAEEEEDDDEEDSDGEEDDGPRRQSQTQRPRHHMLADSRPRRGTKRRGQLVQ